MDVDGGCCCRGDGSRVGRHCDQTVGAALALSRLQQVRLLTLLVLNYRQNKTTRF